MAPEKALLKSSVGICRATLARMIEYIRYQSLHNTTHILVSSPGHSVYNVLLHTDIHCGFLAPSANGHVIPLPQDKHLSIFTSDQNISFKICVSQQVLCFLIYKRLRADRLERAIIAAGRSVRRDTTKLFQLIITLYVRISTNMFAFPSYRCKTFSNSFRQTLYTDPN
jgi:hypothetical protein